MSEQNIQMEERNVREHIANNNYAYTPTARQVLPSRINRFIDDFTAQVELKAARVAAGHTPDDEVEQMFAHILEIEKDLSRERFSATQEAMATPLRTYRTSRRFTRFANLDIAKSGALNTIDLAEIHRPTISPFATSWVHIPEIVDSLVDPDDVLPQSGYNFLGLRVRVVKCIEETDEWGSDEIWLGGNFVDETGDTSTRLFKVSDDFDTGEQVWYAWPGKLMQRFNLKEGGNKFPKIYTAALTLIEEDKGSMSKWWKDLHEKIKAAVTKLLKKAGYAVGQLIGLGELGDLIGSIFASVTKWLMDWIMAIFFNHHDYMGTIVSKATINSYSGNWKSTGGNLAHKHGLFKAHGGRYRVHWKWHLLKDLPDYD